MSVLQALHPPCSQLLWSDSAVTGLDNHPRQDAGGHHSSSLLHKRLASRQAPHSRPRLHMSAQQDRVLPQGKSAPEAHTRLHSRNHRSFQQGTVSPVSCHQKDNTCCSCIEQGHTWQLLGRRIQPCTRFAQTTLLDRRSRQSKQSEIHEGKNTHMDMGKRDSGLHVS